MPGPLSRWTPAQLTQIAQDDPGGELYAATTALAAMTDMKMLSTRRITESDVLSEVGLADGNAILDAMEAASSVRIGRLIRSERGVDICNPESIAMIEQFVSGGTITQAQADKLLAMRAEQRQRWPGIRAADLELARREFAGG